MVDSFLMYITKECDILYHYQAVENNNAIPYIELSYSIKKSVLGEHNLDCAGSLNDLGNLYQDIGEYSRAETYLLRALEIRKSILGEQHPTYAGTLCDIGHLYHCVGDFSRAKQYLLSALKIRKSILGEQHPDYAGSLYTLGNLYIDVGDYSKAETYLLKALELYKSVLGEQHPDYADALCDLGYFYYCTGDISKAEKYLFQALELRKSVSGEQHPDYARTLSNLGFLYCSIGNYSLSEKYLLMALENSKSIFGEQHPDYAISLQNIGTLYSIIGDYSKAETYLLQVLELYKSVLGVQYAGSLFNTLGTIYVDTGDYSKAETYLLQALKLCTSLLGEQHPDYADALCNLGTLYCSMGNYSKAETYLLKALELYKSVLGEQHLNYASTLCNLGTLYCNMGNYSKAETFYIKVFQLEKTNLLNSINFMTERQRKYYRIKMQKDFMRTYLLFAYNYYHQKPSISTFLYDNELFMKGLLLNFSKAIVYSIQYSNDTILINQWNTLIEIKSDIMALREKSPQSKTLTEYEKQAEQLEKEITRKSVTYRESKEQWNITCDSIRNHLLANQVVIEFFIAPLNIDSTYICALLLHHNSVYPEMIPLFEEKEVQKLINTATSSFTNSAYKYNENGAELAQKVWSKILPHIRQGETIYFSPSGVLHQVAIESLPYDSVSTMSDHFNMVRLSSTRELVLCKHDEYKESATLYGGIQYDVDTTDLLAESRLYEQTPLLASRGIENDTTNRGSVKYLYGTKKEAESIERILSKHNVSATLYTSAAANEESFKALSGKHQNIIHIGTHGFYWADSTARKQDFFTQRSMSLSEDKPVQYAIDPLDRCGLLFAGANIALSGHSKDLPDGVQDGILTAKEISLMDLRDCDLVVLSACETAKGDITSEGVFGLQRAFKMAGVQTIIMSLWKVNDDATQMLMTEFYTNWIEKKQSKREAFRNAQNAVRYAVDEDGDRMFATPYYWAGFIMLD